MLKVSLHLNISLWSDPDLFLLFDPSDQCQAVFFRDQKMKPLKQMQLATRQTL